MERDCSALNSHYHSFSVRLGDVSITFRNGTLVLKEQIMLLKIWLLVFKEGFPYSYLLSVQVNQVSAHLYRKADSVLLRSPLQCKWSFLIIFMDLFWRWSSGISGFENLSQLIMVWEVSQHISPFQRLNCILSQFIFLLISQKRPSSDAVSKSIPQFHACFHL